jgi:hypothetical protein
VPAASAAASAAASSSSAAPGASGAPSAGAPEEDKLAEAKRLFRAGNDLRRAGDLPKALELYQRSHDLVPSVPNTWNSATCLADLGRADEALDYYTELLSTLREQLGPEDLASVTSEMTRLRDKVGAIDLRANVDGSVVIDGRARGKLPLLAPLRVLPGHRTVVVIKERYASFETTVEVAAGKTVDMVAKLAPLSAAGQLRIDDAALRDADVTVDGAPVGKVPWQGSLKPGSHLYSVQLGDQGSGPKQIRIVEDQTVLAQPKLLALGPELRVVASQSTAEVLVDDLVVGKGRWQGRLPQGRHRLEAREEGYLPSKLALDVGASALADVTLHLEIDPTHPRWGVEETGFVWLEAMGGFALSPSLGSEAEKSCNSSDFECGSNGLALGVLAGAKVGYEFTFGLSIEAFGGFLYAHKSLERSVASSDMPGARFDLHDSMRVMGPVVAGGVGYRVPLGEVFQLRAHALVGALFGFARDRITGTVTLAAESRDIGVIDDQRQATDNAKAGTNLVVLPAIDLGARFGDLYATLGLVVGLLVLPGPTYPASGIVLPTSANCDHAHPTGIDCVSESDRVKGESAWGTSVLFVPSLGLGYMF